MNATKKLTEASMLSSLFVISTIIAVGSGFGYAIYLDFVVPIFFCIVCLKCGLKYTTLSGITSLFIVGLVLGNIGTAIWTSQSIILGIMCGFFILKPTTILDDIVYTSIIGVILMVLIDVYCSALIGYSFMKEFQEYANKIPFKEYVDVIYYMFIALFPMGIVFIIYTLSLLLAKKLNILNENSKKKLYIISNFRNCGRFICCSKKVFYGALLYLLLFEIMDLIGIKTNYTYLKTIIISIDYLCIYFVLRDSYTSIQNFILIKYQKVSYARFFTLVTLVSLIMIFKISAIVLIIIDTLLDRKINIKVNQINIVNNYVNNLIHK